MTKGFVGLMIPAVLCAMCFCTSSVADTARENILELLQAHDAQFDNMHLTLERTEDVELVSAQSHSYKFDGKIPPGDPSSHRVTASIEFEDQITVRFPEITSIVKTKEDKLHTLPDGGKVRLSPYSKQSNVKGRHQLLNVAESKDNLEGASMLHISPVNGSMDSTQRKWEESELACGYGFSKNIVAISRVDETPEGWHIEGRMVLWETVHASFRLEIDNDLIVRNGRIDARVGEGQRIIEVSTVGTQNLDGMLLPQYGKFQQRVSPVASEDLEAQEKFRLERAFEIRPVALKRNLSDDEYAELVQIEIPQGTFVDDTISKTRYVEGHPEIK